MTCDKVNVSILTCVYLKIYFTNKILIITILKNMFNYLVKVLTTFFHNITSMSGLELYISSSSAMEDSVVQ